MFYRTRCTLSAVIVFIGIFAALPADAFAQEPPSSGTRCGPFGLLDSRSRYGEFWFPEPLRAPEMDVDREIRVDWFHAERAGHQSDRAVAEVEYNIQLLTLEVEVPYEHSSEAAFDAATGRTVHHNTDGIANLELAARHPIFEYVSPNEFFDYTLVGALEIAVPSGSSISKDTELVPQIFQLVRLGEHFSLQASLGYSMLIGPADGGASSLEYNAVFGYAIEEDQFHLPGIQRIVPTFELNGSLGAARADAGHNALSATAGFRVNFDSIGIAQPRVGIGYVFPIDQAARDEFRWGIVTSFVLEF